MVLPITQQEASGLQARTYPKQGEKLTIEKNFSALATQKALWFLQQNKKSHHAQIQMHIEGKVCLPVLVDSLNKLIAQRESLRTILKLNHNGELLQIVKVPFTVDIPLITVGNLDDIVIEQTKTEYDLTRGPMFHMSLLQLHLCHPILLFSFHPFILEGGSWGCLLQELIMLYNNTPDTLAPLRLSTVDYIDYAKDRQQVIPRTVIQKPLVSVDEKQCPTYLEIYCVHHLFEEQVRKTPSAIAVIYDDQQVNYHELNRLSNQLAHYLNDQGVMPDTRVGLCMEPSLDMLIGLLGIMKAGGAYVPLNPSDTEEQLAYQLKHTDINILLTHSSLKSRVLVQQTLNLDTNAEWIGGEWANRNPISPTVPHNLAYVMFSSIGSARASAVAMPHKALANLLQWQMKNSDCASGSKTLLFNPITTGVSFQEILSTWCNGGTLVLAPKKRSGCYTSLWCFIEQEKINRLFMPSHELQDLVAAYRDKKERVIRPAALIEIIISGKSLQITQAIRNFFAQLPTCTLVNQYSHPEVQVSTALKLKGPVDRWEFFLPIGKPITNNKFYILDKVLRPVPVGDFGEIYIGGVGLAQGYLNKVVFTERRFILNPFAKVANEYLYKTGDFARFQPNGNVELLRAH